MLAFDALLVKQLFPFCIECASDLFAVFRSMMVMDVMVMGNVCATPLVVLRVAIGSNQRMAVECILVFPLLQGGLARVQADYIGVL